MTREDVVEQIFSIIVGKKKKKRRKRRRNRTRRERKGRQSRKQPSFRHTEEKGKNFIVPFQTTSPMTLFLQQGPTS
jgi:hypothetical protein